jgi:hypothetical protein
MLHDAADDITGFADFPVSRWKKILGHLPARAAEQGGHSPGWQIRAVAWTGSRGAGSVVHPPRSQIIGLASEPAGGDCGYGGPGASAADIYVWSRTPTCSASEP